MKEIRIHGRGGQGSLVLAQFIAIAALEDGKYGQAFPFLGGGGERRGKPIMAFCRLSDQPIRLRSRVSQPDYVIVQDATILNELDVTQGLKKNGLLLINTEQALPALERSGQFQIRTFSADGLARSILGRPIMNTALLGAFAAITEELSLEATLRAVEKKFPGELGQKNSRLVRECYQTMRGETP
jgi:pyruvate ferredoxin oxidoreductase gamma subunit